MDPASARCQAGALPRGVEPLAEPTGFRSMLGWRAWAAPLVRCPAAWNRWLSQPAFARCWAGGPGPRRWCAAQRRRGRQRRRRQGWHRQQRQLWGGRRSGFSGGAGGNGGGGKAGTGNSGNFGVDGEAASAAARTSAAAKAGKDFAESRTTGLLSASEALRAVQVLLLRLGRISPNPVRPDCCPHRKPCEQYKCCAAGHAEVERDVLA